jgi:beta-phosphoglucomutase
VFDVAAPRRAERAKREEQERTADPEDCKTGDDDHRDHVLEVGLHRAGTVTMRERPRNLPRRVEAAIFDFDETIINLERQHTAACVRLCRAMGSRYEDMSEEFRMRSGKRVIDDIRDMRSMFGWQRPVDDLLAERQRYFDEEIAASTDLELMAGVRTIVAGLHARGITLAIASSAVRSSIETVLARFDLLRLFAVIVDGSEVERGKPDPQAYLVTAGRLGVDPAQCVVFEDATVGVRAAKAAGMYCIAVRNPRAQTLQDLGPADFIVSSFEEIDAGWFTTSSSNSR